MCKPILGQDKLQRDKLLPPLRANLYTQFLDVTLLTANGSNAVSPLSGHETRFLKNRIHTFHSVQDG